MDLNNKKILCIRADNMGDVIMSTPALSALKESFNCKITLLTSKMGAPILPHISDIDDSMVANLPWVKANESLDAGKCTRLIQEIKEKKFDAAIIFTVYSQNPLPSALLCFLAEIPVRIAYCRENPYELLTHWLPDDEPYSCIRHQIERDLALVQFAGAKVKDDRLHLKIALHKTDKIKLEGIEIDAEQPFILIHTAVSEKKREYPEQDWIETLRLLRKKTAVRFYLTGSSSEKESVNRIVRNANVSNCVSLAGKTSVADLIFLIKKAALLLSVNTASIHIAAAMQTPVVVLYALTNPQHTPWKVKSKVLYFKVNEELQSRNEVIRFVQKTQPEKTVDFPTPEIVADACMELLNQS
ncbi:MAG TPA: glycosyltransferase family 9 protein [Hanamia sp.]|nr:glycosyltransferase family 9 protein [Hanamia sp.]